MLDPIQQIKEQISGVLLKAIYKAVDDGSLSYNELPYIKVDKTHCQQYGDFYSNIAMEMVRASGRPSDYIAEKLLQHADLSGTYIERMEVMGPGFINVFLKPKWLYDVLTIIIKEKDEYGRLAVGMDQKVLISFMHADLGDIIWGDCLANTMEMIGYDVVREFYVDCHWSQEDVENTARYMRQWGVVFSAWVKGQQLYELGDVWETIEELDIIGNTRRSNGTIWFVDDKLEMLLIDEHGTFTDFALYVAYHRKKILKEGYDRIINIWSRELRDTFEAVSSVMNCLGCEPERLEYLAPCSKVLDIEYGSDLISRDVLRFISSNPERNYSVKKLSQQQRDNPLFEVQYAYARICSIFRHMDSKQLVLMPPEELDFSILRHPSERVLMRRLADFPREIKSAAEYRKPGRLTDYLIDVARLFHDFYDQCRVRISNRDLMYARLGLIEATRIVLANGLYVLNIQAPERM